MAQTTFFDLRSLPLPVRLTLAMFLVAAGVGYLTGLVQLHFAHAREGRLLPSAADAAAAYHGTAGPLLTPLERLLTTPTGPFNSTGTMRPAFFEKSAQWKETVKQRPEADVRPEREGELAALLAWLRAGAPADAYDADRFPLPPDLAPIKITVDFVTVDDDGQPVEPKTVAIKSLIEQRCVRCHQEGGEAAKYPLDSHASLMKYHQEPNRGGMSNEKIALITHVHMMGFAVLFGFTGVIFSFTSYPTLVRIIFGPLTLLAQVLEIGCWWLTRLDPSFAYGITILGTVVAVTLCVQILGGLVDLLLRKAP